MQWGKIYKAQGIGDKEIVSLSIEFGEQIPYGELEGTKKLFEDQGRYLEKLLYSVLPGGTYDRLLGEMLCRKGSKLIVSYGGLDEKQD